MKKRVSFAFALLMATWFGVHAQNVQQHYDLGHALDHDLTTRGSVTTTVEMFKPDKWGSTFLFTDIDYKGDGVMGAYWEIAREFNVSHNKQFAAHFEYNGGAGTGETSTGQYYGSRYQHAVLLGGAWNWHNADFSTTFSLQAMYKYYFKNSHTGTHPFNGFQTTAVWGVQLADGRVTCSGFADLWYDPNVKGKLIFLSEPQLWFNMNKLRGWDGINLSVGTEIELSNNFVWNDKGENDKFYAIPTLALKWTF